MRLEPVKLGRKEHKGLLKISKDAPGNSLFRWSDLYTILSTVPFTILYCSNRNRTFPFYDFCAALLTTIYIFPYVSFPFLFFLQRTLFPLFHTTYWGGGGNLFA